MTMQIICPECQFTREVDETKIPAKSQVATCPKCKMKFKFRELREEAFSLEETTETTPSGTPEPTTPPTLEEPEPLFPKITSPGENPKDELWDKLGDMTPPENKQDEQPPAASDQQPVPGWTGEFNGEFPDPMQTDMGDEDTEESPMLVPPPFEQLDRYGFFNGLYMTIKLVLTSPRLFFSVMPVGGGLAKPLTFTILLSMIQGFAQYFWGMAGVSSYVETGSTKAIGGTAGSMSALLMLLFMPAFIAAGQFMITGIYHLLLMLMRADNQGFEGTFRALAYANAPLILGIFPQPILEVETTWMFITAIWGLFLTILGLKYIHKTSFAKVIPVALVPLLLAMIAALTLFQDQLPTI
ncbi:MAG: zinc-ribbon domain-containing protein [Pseudodesulfovibrio sp.]|nr:zinc-ribbon domain-containing protein [Pseudodesulfovibrio sp.]